MCYYKICWKAKWVHIFILNKTVNLETILPEHRKGEEIPKSKRSIIYIYKFIRSNGGMKNWDYKIKKTNYTCNLIVANTIHKN